MRKALLPVLCALLALTLPSCDKIPGMSSEVKDDDKSARSALVGVWRGGGTYDNEEDSGWTESWRMERKEDGNYHVEYLIIHAEDKLYERSSDAGTWGYEKGVYFEVNSQGGKISYDVFSVKKDWFEYNIAERVGTANIEESKTVDNFQLQNPPEDFTENLYDQSPSQVEVEASDNLPTEKLDLPVEILDLPAEILE